MLYGLDNGLITCRRTCLIQKHWCKHVVYMSVLISLSFHFPPFIHHSQIIIQENGVPSARRNNAREAWPPTNSRQPHIQWRPKYVLPADLRILHVQNVEQFLSGLHCFVPSRSPAKPRSTLFPGRGWPCPSSAKQRLADALRSFSCLELSRGPQPP